MEYSNYKTPHRCGKMSPYVARGPQYGDGKGNGPVSGPELCRLFSTMVYGQHIFSFCLNLKLPPGTFSFILRIIES